MKRFERGLSLAELLIALVLSMTVMMGAFNLMISFGKFSSNFVKNEASVMGTVLGTFEEIAGKISTANQLTLASSSPYNSIEIRIAPSGSGASFDHSGDTIHYYRQDGSQLKYKSKVGTNPVSAETVIANDIVTASFSPVGTLKNLVSMGLEVKPSAGPRETLQTSVIAQSRSAR